jgi:hypothetical protein
VPIADLPMAGFSMSSIFRMKLFTLDHSLVFRQISRLRGKDQASVRDALRTLVRTKQEIALLFSDLSHKSGLYSS